MLRRVVPRLSPRSRSLALAHLPLRSHGAPVRYTFDHLLVGSLFLLLLLLICLFFAFDYLCRVLRRGCGRSRLAPAPRCARHRLGRHDAAARARRLPLARHGRLTEQLLCPHTRCVAPSVARRANRPPQAKNRRFVAGARGGARAHRQRNAAEFPPSGRSSCLQCCASVSCWRA